MKLNPMKNIITFNAALPAAKALTEHLQELPFTELTESMFSSYGFVANPITRELVSEFKGGLSISIRYDEKILPAAAVNDEVNKRVLAIEEETGQGVTRKEKQAIKEMVLADLVKQALTRSVIIHAYHHTDSGRLFVATSSDKMASLVMSMLVKVVGSVQTKTTHVADAKHGLTTRLRALIAGGGDCLDGFGQFEVGDSCRLVRDQGQKEVINYTGTEIAVCDELIEKLDSGYMVEALALSINHLSFKLTHEFRMKSLSWNDVDDAEYDNQIEAWMNDAAAKLFLLNHTRATLLEMLEYREEDKEQAA